MDVNVLSGVANNLNKGLPNIIQEHGLGLLVLVFFPLCIACLLSMIFLGFYISIDSGVLMLISGIVAVLALCTKMWLIGKYVLAWEEAGFRVSYIIRLTKDLQFRKSRIAAIKNDLKEFEKESEDNIYYHLVDTLHNFMTFPNLSVYVTGYLVLSSIFYTAIFGWIFAIFGKISTIDYSGVSWVYYVFLAIFSGMPLILSFASLWIDFFYLIRNKLKEDLMVPCCVEVETDCELIFGFIDYESKDTIKIIASEYSDATKIPSRLSSHRKQHEVQRKQIKRLVRHYLKESREIRSSTI